MTNDKNRGIVSVRVRMCMCVRMCMLVYECVCVYGCVIFHGVCSTKLFVLHVFNSGSSTCMPKYYIGFNANSRQTEVCFDDHDTCEIHTLKWSHEVNKSTHIRQRVNTRAYLFWEQIIRFKSYL